MKPMYEVKDVEELLCVGETKAYQIIRTLNEELQEKGFMTVRGRVSSSYLKERFFGITEAGE